MPSAASNATHRTFSRIDIPLSPSQQETYESLLEAKAASTLVVLTAPPGFGKTTLAKRLATEFAGVFLDARRLMLSLGNGPHSGMETAFLRLMETAMAQSDLIVIDDFDLASFTYSWRFYVRTGMIEGLMQTLFDRARTEGKTLIFLGEDFLDSLDGSRRFHFFDGRVADIHTTAFTRADFGFFLGLSLSDDEIRGIDLNRLHEVAPSLNGHQLYLLGARMRTERRTDEAFLREILQTEVGITNVETAEVAPVRFEDLKGFESIIATLQTYVLNALTHDHRVQSFDLAPKRGVLLFGPPGTGKTSIGRALAHQMQGKFFMIDGTITTEPPGMFYAAIRRVFDAAKKAAPCVVFIDDADVLFQSDRSTGLTRYLLTMLDGLESETAGKVAVMMTAMDPNHMPPALLRSGRVELWLETKPPSDIARAEIIAADATSLPEQLRNYKFEALADITAGFNAADMRRIVADVKALYARDVVENRKPKPADQYFAAAAEGVRDNKVLLGLAETGNLKLEEAH